MAPDPTLSRLPDNPLPAQRIAPTLQHALGSLHTVRDLVRYGTTRLQAAEVALGHGTDNAFDEAVWLVLWSLHLPPDRLDVHLEARVTAPELRATLELIERRCAERIPAAYLTGEAWLRGVRFLSDPRALVPRSPIAELLDTGSLEPWVPDADAVDSVLDLCTGGGSLAILAARAWPQARVIGADLSEAALNLAAANVALHRLGDRVSLRHGHLWAPVAGECFDLIICNPPYVNSASMQALPAEYRHEPASALGGGTDGMDLVREIVAGAARHLSPQGILVLEIGHEAAHFEAAFPRLEGVWMPTSPGDDQVIVLEHGALAAIAASAPSGARR